MARDTFFTPTTNTWICYSRHFCMVLFCQKYKICSDARNALHITSHIFYCFCCWLSTTFNKFVKLLVCCENCYSSANSSHDSAKIFQMGDSFSVLQTDMKKNLPFCWDAFLCCIKISDDNVTTYFRLVYPFITPEVLSEFFGCFKEL